MKVGTLPLLASLLIICCQYSVEAQDLPNIILLLADDLGYEELGCQGNTDIPTPNIDALAADGVRFTNGYVTNSYCSPSRAGLLTGRYPNRFGYETNLIGAENEDPELGLPPGQVTIAEYLLEAGYISSLLGKWHQGGTAKHHPFRQGFDEFYGFLHEGHYFLPPPYHGATTMLRRKVLPGGGSGRWISEDGKLIYSSHMGHSEPDYDANNPIVRGSQPAFEEEYFTNAITREAIDFIERQKENPFFLYVAYNAVHSPLQAIDEFMDKFAHIEDVHRRIFAAMVSNLDASVGSIMQKLREEGLEDNTLIIFLSDNGGPTKELTSSNLPLRGGKGSYYEGGIRIPFIMQWKNELPGGQIYERPVISLDIFNSVAAASGKPVSEGWNDGVNLIPYLRGERSGEPHSYLFWSFRDKMALRMGDWKIVRNSGNGKVELYNLKTDISEEHDLSMENLKRTNQMIKLWTDLNSEMIAQSK